MARERIIEGAMAVFAEKGLHGTAEDVAEAAGVSRRTVFRHFATHGELFALVMAKVLETYQEEVPKLVTALGDLEPWLASTAAEIHRLNRDVLGRGFWDIHIQGPGSEPEVLAILEERYGWRYALYETVAKAAWKAKGGRGKPPGWVVDACVLCLSGFATAAGQSYGFDDAAAVSSKVLSAVLAAAIGEHKEAGG